MSNNKVYYFLIFSVIFILGAGVVSAASDNVTSQDYEDNTVEDAQQIDDNIEYDEKTDYNTITKKNTTSQSKSASDASNTVKLDVKVENVSVALESDSGSEVVLLKNISLTDSKPDVTKLGVDYAYADENGTYTILGSEIRRVMKLDSYCQQIYGYVPKYTFFRVEGSNVKYIISREKWNVIARSLNSYHVNKGYTAVNTPYSITVNLTGKSRYYNVYYDAQEYINGHRYTCGPTSMSMISQALNCYASERKLAGLYGTTAAYGTSESSIIKYSPSAHMKLTNIANTQSSVKAALESGKMVFWHISGHYMCIIGYNSANDKFLCLNPSGPSHNIAAVQWATWTEVMSTNRALKDNGFMAVTPYWNLTTQDKTYAANYYYNMGGKYTIPSNNEYPNNGLDNKITVVADTPSNVSTKTNQTNLVIKATVGSSFSNGKVVFYLNNQQIGVSSITNNIAGMNYTLPAYASENIELTACVVNSTITSIEPEVSVYFKKFTAGNTYTNTTTVKLEHVEVSSVTGKKDDNVTFKAYVYDNNAKPVNGGKVVFKINGITIKEDDNPVKVNVVNGTASYTYTLPAFSVKNYTITAVYGNDTTRLENNATLTINKQDTKIINTQVIKSTDKITLLAKVVDIYGNKVECDTKISVKIDSRTVVDKLKVVDGIINMTIDTTLYKLGNHSILIIAGENGVYQSSRRTTSFTLENDDITQLETSISNVKVSSNNRILHVTGSILDNNTDNVRSDVKLSAKLNGVTVLNQAVVKNGVINQTIDLSQYKSREYTFSMITESTPRYESTRYNSTIILS